MSEKVIIEEPMAEIKDGERRINCTAALQLMHEEMLRDHKLELGAISSQIIKANEFRSNAKLAGSIAMAVWFAIFLGSFIYTYNYKVMAQQEHDQLHRVINENVRSIGSLQAKVLVSEDRYTRVLTDLKSLDNKLERLIRVLTHNEEIDRDEYR